MVVVDSVVAVVDYVKLWTIVVVDSVMVVVDYERW